MHTPVCMSLDILRTCQMMLLYVFILKQPELLEPLMPTIRSCLEHRHCYVRRNAVMAIYTIYKYETVLSSLRRIYCEVTP